MFVKISWVTTACGIISFLLFLLIPVSLSQVVEGQFSASVPVAYAASVPSPTFFSSIFDGILKQVNGVFGFGAQAIRAVMDVPAKGLATNTATDALVSFEGASRKTIGNSLLQDFSSTQKGALIINLPLSIDNRLQVSGTSTFGSAQVRSVLTVFGTSQLNTVQVLGLAQARELSVSSLGTFGSLSVTSAATVGSLSVLGTSEVAGLLTATGGVVTHGADIDTQGGKVFASNIINTLVAGRNVTISGTANAPIISVKSSGGGSSAGVTSVNGVSGIVTLASGDDIVISGLTVSSNATLASVRTRGGCVDCITDADVAQNLTINGGAIDNTVIGSTTAAAAFFTKLTVTNTATSTFAGSINLTGGCFAVGGTCIGATVSVRKLTDLSDVGVSLPAKGELLMYNGTTWNNRATSTLGFGNNTFLGLRDTPSSYIAKSLLYTNATGSALTQSAQFVFDGTRLGVGTSTPINTLSVSGDVGILGRNALRLYEVKNKNYVGFQASSSQSSNVVWTLPTSDGTPDQLLVTNGAGSLRFADAGTVGGGSPNFLGLTDTANSFIDRAIPFVASSSLGFSNNLTFDGLHLGIGTNAPPSTLSVVGSVAFGPDMINPTFVYNATSTRIGIGTSNPSELLAVQGGSLLQRGGATGHTYVPKQVGSLDLPDNANDVAIAGTIAYVVGGSGGNEFQVIDISKPSNPISISSLALPASANSVYVSGRYAYVVTDVAGSEFFIIDLTDIAHPAVVSSLAMPTSAFGVTVQGRYAYITTAGAGNDFHVVDIGNPLAPREVGSLNLPTAANAVTVAGRYAYVVTDKVGDGFYVIDINDPTSPVVTDSLPLPSIANDVVVRGSYAYVVTASAGNDFHVINISDPANVFLVGGLNLVTGATGVALAGNYAYVSTAGTGNDIHVIDISTPATPIEVGSEELASGVGLGVKVSGKYAYVLTSSSGSEFHVMDITGVEAQSVFASSLEAGSFSVQGDIVAGGSASLTHGLRTGIEGVQTDGALYVLGTSTSFFRGNLGVGTTTSAYKLTVAGDARITGKLYDSTNFAGSNGMVLKATATGFQWVATSTLGLGGGGGGSGIVASGNSGYFGYYPSTGNTVGGQTVLNISGTNIGIGVIPTQKLDVAGFINTDIYSGYKQGGVTVLKASSTNLLVGNGAGNALRSTAFNNTAIGYQALFTATSSSNNTATGYQSLYSNTTGSVNTANGLASLYSNTTGSANTALGYAAGYEINTATGTGNNTIIGYNTGRGITTGVNNTILGANVTGLASGLSNNIILADGAGNRRINVDSSGRVGIGTSSPTRTLTVAGSARLTGGFYDSANNIGTKGMILLTSGTSTRWVATSTLGLAGSGSGLTSLNGQLNSTQTFASSTAGTDFKISSNSGIHTFQLPSASPLARGLLTASDWTSFNGRIASSSLNTSAKLASLITDETGTGALVFGTSPTLSSTTISGIFKLSGQTASRVLFTDALSRATTTALSATLLNSLTDETGTGVVVFNTSPTFTTQITTPIVTNAGTLALQATGANIITASTNGVERMRIDSAGLVGIGVTSPGSKLQIADSNLISGTSTNTFGYNTTSNASIYTTNAEGADIGALIGLGGMRDSAATVPSVFGGIRGAKENSTSGNASGYLGFYTANSGVNFAERMRITSMGNVGIGSSTPTSKLVVKGTAGSLQDVFSVASSTNTKLFTVRSNGNVGIGTSTPTSNLHIDSGTSNFLPSITLSGRGSSLQYIGRASANFTGANTNDLGVFYSQKFFLGNTANAALAIDSSGRVGIGTSTPSAKLHVTGTAGNGDIFAISSSTNTRLLTVKSTGNVGIGTVSPNVTLEVAGQGAIGDSITSTRLNSANGPRALSVIDSNASMRIWRYSAAQVASSIELGIGNNTDLANAANKWWDIYLQGNAPNAEQLGFRRRTGNTSSVYMVIDASGNIGVGTTSPSAKFHITGTAGNGDIFAISSSTNTKLLTVKSTGNVGIGTTTPSQKLSVVGTIQSTVLLGGATSLSTDAQGNIIRTPSDERLKINVATIGGALEKVLGLRGVTYTWKDTKRFGDQTEVGFLAQEVDPILPEVVRKGGEYWSLNTSNIVAVVVEAIKQLWSNLQNQQAQIHTLESRVQSLESQLHTQTNTSQSHTNNGPSGTSTATTTVPVSTQETGGGSTGGTSTSGAGASGEQTPTPADTSVPDVTTP